MITPEQEECMRGIISAVGYKKPNLLQEVNSIFEKYHPRPSEYDCLFQQQVSSRLNMFNLFLNAKREGKWDELAVIMQREVRTVLEREGPARAEEFSKLVDECRDLALQLDTRERHEVVVDTVELDGGLYAELVCVDCS